MCITTKHKHKTSRVPVQSVWRFLPNIWTVFSHKFFLRDFQFETVTVYMDNPRMTLQNINTSSFFLSPQWNLLVSADPSLSCCSGHGQLLTTSPLLKGMDIAETRDASQELCDWTDCSAMEKLIDTPFLWENNYSAHLFHGHITSVTQTFGNMRMAFFLLVILFNFCSFLLKYNCSNTDIFDE